MEREFGKARLYETLRDFTRLSEGHGSLDWKRGQRSKGRSGGDFRGKNGSGLLFDTVN